MRARVYFFFTQVSSFLLAKCIDIISNKHIATEHMMRSKRTVPENTEQLLNQILIIRSLKLINKKEI